MRTPPQLNKLSKQYNHPYKYGIWYIIPDEAIRNSESDVLPPMIDQHVMPAKCEALHGAPEAEVRFINI